MVALLITNVFKHPDSGPTKSGLYCAAGCIKRGFDKQPPLYFCHSKNVSLTFFFFIEYIAVTGQQVEWTQRNQQDLFRRWNNLKRKSLFSADIFITALRCTQWLAHVHACMHDTPTHTSSYMHIVHALIQNHTHRHMHSE